MKTYGVGEFMREAQRLEAELTQALIAGDQRERAHAARMQELRELRRETLAQLVSVLLPDFTPASLQRAGRAAAFGPLLLADETHGRLASEREGIEERLRAIVVDSRFVHRELLRAPRVGQLSRELDELEDFRKPMAELLGLAAHERLAVLLENGYGSDAYQTPWWRASYYADWKAGDEILERFPGKQVFAELRGELVAAVRDLAVYDQRIAELRGEIAAGEALEAEHAHLSDRLKNLEAIHLEGWRQRLGQHIAALEPAELGDRLQGEEAAQLLVKTFAGLGKKMDYLGKVNDEQVLVMNATLRNELHKLKADEEKLRRPKKAGTRFPADKFEKRFASRRERYNKHWKRHDRTYETVYEFHHYERASFVEEFLWWDLFTDGQIDGNFIPEVQAFHHQHPGYTWSGGGFDDDLGGAAALASLEADREPVSQMGDPS